MANHNAFNVILVTCDCLRWDHVDWDKPEDRKKGLMPSTRGFAEQAVKFSNCYSQGASTSPSASSFLTSTYPLDYGKHWVLAHERKTIAEILKSNRYRTAGFHSCPNVGRASNYHKGFDIYKDNIIPGQFSFALERLPRKYYWMINKFFRLLRRQPSLPARDINHKALSWLKKLTGAPFFLWVHYMDVHGPYMSHRGFGYLDKFRQEMLYRKAAVKNPQGVTQEERDQLIGNYREEIRGLDREMARFFSDLDTLNILDNSLVVVTADHGDEFGEHGLFGHINKPYNELIHVPFIIRFPPACRIAPAVIEARVRLLDLLPTILDFLNIPVDPAVSEQIEGESMMPLIYGKTGRLNFDYIFIEKEAKGTGKIQIGLIHEHWKYIYDTLHNERELYNLMEDPREQCNVIGEYPELASRYHEVIKSHIRKISSRSEDITLPELVIDSDMHARLKALGYV